MHSIGTSVSGLNATRFEPDPPLRRVMTVVSGKITASLLKMFVTIPRTKSSAVLKTRIA